MAKREVIIKIVSFLLTAIGIVTLLGVVKVDSSELPAGEMAKQYHYLAWASLVFAGCMGIVWILSFYRQSKNIPVFYPVVAWVLIALGGFEALYGLRQLYGFAYSHHSLYSLTGSFFNPGPYSGYLAMVFPLCLYEWLILKEKKDRTWIETVGLYVAVSVLFLILCVLPAGMSRSAWLAALLSGTWVYGVHAGWKAKLQEAWMKKKKMLIGVGAMVFVCICLGGIALFHVKKDSANGRLFMWKVSSLAIAEQPLSGYGGGNFAYAYGKAQEAYFNQGDYSLQEEMVAGSPEYAFNEYLQIALQWGLPALFLVMVVLVFCLWRGVKLGKIGVCGAIISLMVFSFSSYPMQLPVFIFTFACLIMAALAGSSRKWLLAWMVAGILFSVFSRKADAYEACREWTHAQMLYRTGACESAVKDYERLHPQLRQRGVFLFEYGHCLHKLKRYDESTVLLKEAARRSCDPMILNIIGKNCQEKRKYIEAEQWLMRSTHLLPGRIYPYYLLAKLYAVPDFYQPEKLKEVARIVMTKEPKVQSTAIREMREEIKKIIKDKGL